MQITRRPLIAQLQVVIVNGLPDLLILLHDLLLKPAPRSTCDIGSLPQCVLVNGAQFRREKESSHGEYVRAEVVEDFPIDGPKGIALVPWYDCRSNTVLKSIKKEVVQS